MQHVVHDHQHRVHHGAYRLQLAASSGDSVVLCHQIVVPLVRDRPCPFPQQRFQPAVAFRRFAALALAR